MYNNAVCYTLPLGQEMDTKCCQKCVLLCQIAIPGIQKWSCGRENRRHAVVYNNAVCYTLPPGQEIEASGPIFDPLGDSFGQFRWSNGPPATLYSVLSKFRRSGGGVII